MANAPDELSALFASSSSATILASVSELGAALAPDDVVDGVPVSTAGACAVRSAVSLYRATVDVNVGNCETER